MKIETLSEEMRVLYVALTRAKEKIIITGLAKKERQDKMLENVEKYDELNIMLLSKSKSYLDWITLVHLYYEQTMESLATWNVLQKRRYYKNVCYSRARKRRKNKTDEILKKLNEFKIEDVKANEIQKLLEYQYKYSDATIIPTKTSVTEIKEMKKSALGEKSKKEENTKMKQCVFREENESEKENIVSKVEFPKPKFLQSDEKNRNIKCRKRYINTFVYAKIRYK